jgi:hypothetical protein
MPLKKITYEGSARPIENGTSDFKQLAYTGEAKDFIHNNPEVIRKILDLIKNVNQEPRLGARVEDGDISVEMIRGWDTQPRYKIQVGSKLFFLKIREISEEAEDQGGFYEAMDTREAETLLTGIEGIEVSRYQLGYTDRKKKYFVSEWFGSHVLGIREYLGENYPSAPSHGSLEDSRDPEKERVQAIIREVIPILSQNNYWDIGIDNMVYDPVSKKVIVFDLNKKRSNTNP